MAEIIEVQFKPTIGVRPDCLPHFFQEPRSAIGRKPHDLVFVAVIRKAEILRKRLIENAERMGKQDAALLVNTASLADAPDRTGKVSESVNRDDSCAVERRYVKGGGEMRDMMLDVSELS